MMSVSTKKDINGLPGFNLLTREEKLSVSRACSYVNYRSGEVLFKQGTPVFQIIYVLGGLVKVYKETQNGKMRIFNISNSGSLLGHMTVFGGEIHQYSASAIGNVEVALIEISVILDIIKGNGEFAYLMLKQAGEDGLNVLSSFMNQSQKQLPGRIAEMLVFFSEKIYKSYSFELPLSRRELAEFVGTTKESMIRTLAEFRHDNIIKLNDKNVEIISPEIIHVLSRCG